MDDSDFISRPPHECVILSLPQGYRSGTDETQVLLQPVTESFDIMMKQPVSQIPRGIVNALSAQFSDEYQRLFKLNNIDGGFLS